MVLSLRDLCASLHFSSNLANSMKSSSCAWEVDILSCWPRGLLHIQVSGRMQQLTAKMTGALAASLASIGQHETLMSCQSRCAAPGRRFMSSAPASGRQCVGYLNLA